MASMSSEEVKNSYTSSMGEELGSAFFHLDQKLVELHIVWQQFRQLYGTNEETVQLLNRTAGLFFKVVQDELWDSVLLGISRMTDPADTRWGKNLTIQSLPPLIAEPGLKAEEQNLCDTAVGVAIFARNHRNKRIAHQDHNYLVNRTSNPIDGVSRERVEIMLEALRKVMNRLDSHFRDTTVIYEDFLDETGARLLVSKLIKLERL
jgi:hypothetical protein